MNRPQPKKETSVPAVPLSSVIVAVQVPELGVPLKTPRVRESSGFTDPEQLLPTVVAALSVKSTRVLLL